MSEWAGVLIFLVVAIGFGAGGIITSFIIHPRSKSPQKFEAYECGVPSVGPTWVRFRSSYFLCALLFLIFDVELIYLYPWAVKLQELGIQAFVKMFIFITLLVVGLWYAWKEGALEWN